MRYYVFFALIIIPFQTLMDMIFMNVVELHHGNHPNCLPFISLLLDPLHLIYSVMARADV
jgi:hypothetical protein